MQQWFNLSDPEAEDAIYDSESMRRFARVELGDDVVPDETTILRFRHLLEKHRLTEVIFEAVKDLLAERRLMLKSGTIVDATIISAPSSTKNAAQRRDPEMKQTKKGNTWYFGMKLHVATDTKGLVHSLTTSNAAVAEHELNCRSCSAGKSGRSMETAPTGASRIARSSKAAESAIALNRRSNAGAPLSERWRQINRARSRIRARGEHAFHVVKRLWGFAKVRYRGLAKNATRAFAMFAQAYSVPGRKSTASRTRPGAPGERKATFRQRFSRSLRHDAKAGHRLSIDTLMNQSCSRIRALTCAEIFPKFREGDGQTSDFPDSYERGGGRGSLARFW